MMFLEKKLWKKQVNGSGFNWSKRMLQLVNKKHEKATKF